MSVRQLAQPPALAPLVARSMLAAPFRRPAVAAPELADLTLQLAPRPAADPERLRRYQQLCGFRVSDWLPPTYLHLLGFPLAVTRMAEPDFPFPLLGVVHLHNTIRAVRPVRAGEQVVLATRADRLRPHPAGDLIDLVTEARIGDELVWHETSCYLHRHGRHSAPRPRPEQPDFAGAAIARWRLPADLGRRYARVSGDRNPIHLHPITARAFGYRTAIAHGMWLAARTVAAFEGRLPPAVTIDVAFKTPAFLPSTVELRSARADGGWDLLLGNPESGKPHLAGTIRPA